MSASEPLLVVRGLCAWYGAAQILFDIDLEVGHGEVVALMGRNGAGKSTTFLSLMGLVPRRSGTIRFMHEDISTREPHQIARLGIGFVPEDRRIFTELTVAENLEVGRRLPCERRGKTSSTQDAPPPWTPERLFRLFPNLAGMQDRSAARMSGGEQQMLAVARTLMGNPRLVLLDEPSEGIAPVIVEQMAATILELKAQGVSILLSEQNLSFAEQVADRVYGLERGQVRFAGGMPAYSATI